MNIDDNSYISVKFWDRSKNGYKAEHHIYYTPRVQLILTSGSNEYAMGHGESGLWDWQPAAFLPVENYNDCWGISADYSYEGVEHLRVGNCTMDDVHLRY